MKPSSYSTVFSFIALAVLSFTAVAQPLGTRSFPIPTPSCQPINITLGPDGNFWFTEQDSSRIGRITPQGVITEFVTPTFSFPWDITAGPDGNVWFSEGSVGQIGLITPDGQIEEIKFSNFDASAGITTGPDGNIWFTDSTGNNIWRVDIVTHALTKFPIPTPDSFPNDIITGPDGNLWFAELSAGKIGRITVDGIITEFGNNLGGVYTITDGPDGNVWFTLRFTPMVGRITPAGDITLFPTPNSPENITRGPANLLYFTEFGVNRIAKMTTAGVVTESEEFLHSGPTGITAGLRRGDIWFLGYSINRVYRTTFSR
jgi:virginiamycin B lyase